MTVEVDNFNKVVNIGKQLGKTLGGKTTRTKVYKQKQVGVSDSISSQ